MIKGNQKSWAKFVYYYKYRAEKKCKKIMLKRIFLKILNNTVFGKTMENIRNHRDVKLVTSKAKRNYKKVKTRHLPWNRKRCGHEI